MKSSARKIQLASYDDLFKNDEERLADTQERIQMLSPEKLQPFPNHPFKVVDDEKMMDMVESIKEYGVLVPIIVRPVENGNYEIVSDTADTMPLFWQDRRKFLQSLGKWTRMPLFWLWWTVIYKGKISCLRKRLLLIG